MAGDVWVAYRFKKDENNLNQQGFFCFSLSLRTTTCPPSVGDIALSHLFSYKVSGILLNQGNFFADYTTDAIWLK